MLYNIEDDSDKDIVLVPDYNGFQKLLEDKYLKIVPLAMLYANDLVISKQDKTTILDYQIVKICIWLPPLYQKTKETGRVSIGDKVTLII